jgi:hypothetical protein
MQLLNVVQLDLLTKWKYPRVALGYGLRACHHSVEWNLAKHKSGLDKMRDGAHLWIKPRDAWMLWISQIWIAAI